MGIKTETTYICDCCGRESGHTDFSNCTDYGYAEIELNKPDGVGGLEYSDILICFSCANAIMKTFDGIKKKSGCEKDVLK